MRPSAQSDARNYALELYNSFKDRQTDAANLLNLRRSLTRYIAADRGSIFSRARSTVAATATQDYYKSRGKLILRAVEHISASQATTLRDEEKTQLAISLATVFPDNLGSIQTRASEILAETLQTLEPTDITPDRLEKTLEILTQGINPPLTTDQSVVPAQKIRLLTQENFELLHSLHAHPTQGQSPEFITAMKLIDKSLSQESEQSFNENFRRNLLTRRLNNILLENNGSLFKGERGITVLLGKRAAFVQAFRLIQKDAQSGDGYLHDAISDALDFSLKQVYPNKEGKEYDFQYLWNQKRAVALGVLAADSEVDRESLKRIELELEGLSLAQAAQTSFNTYKNFQRKKLSPSESHKDSKEVFRLDEEIDIEHILLDQNPPQPDQAPSQEDIAKHKKIHDYMQRVIDRSEGRVVASLGAVSLEAKRASQFYKILIDQLWNGQYFEATNLTLVDEVNDKGFVVTIPDRAAANKYLFVGYSDGMIKTPKTFFCTGEANLALLDNGNFNETALQAGQRQAGQRNLPSKEVIEQVVAETSQPRHRSMASEVRAVSYLSLDDVFDQLVEKNPTKCLVHLADNKIASLRKVRNSRVVEYKGGSYLLECTKEGHYSFARSGKSSLLDRVKGLPVGLMATLDNGLRAQLKKEMQLELLKSDQTPEVAELAKRSDRLEVDFAKLKFTTTRERPVDLEIDGVALTALQSAKPEDKDMQKLRKALAVEEPNQHYSTVKKVHLTSLDPNTMDVVESGTVGKVKITKNDDARALYPFRVKIAGTFKKKHCYVTHEGEIIGHNSGSVVTNSHKKEVIQAFEELASRQRVKNYMVEAASRGVFDAGQEAHRLALLDQIGKPENFDQLLQTAEVFDLDYTENGKAKIATGFKYRVQQQGGFVDKFIGFNQSGDFVSSSHVNSSARDTDATQLARMNEGDARQIMQEALGLKEQAATDVMEAKREELLTLATTSAASSNVPRSATSSRGDPRQLKATKSPEQKAQIIHDAIVLSARDAGLHFDVAGFILFLIKDENFTKISSDEGQLSTVTSFINQKFSHRSIGKINNKQLGKLSSSFQDHCGEYGLTGKSNDGLRFVEAAKDLEDVEFHNLLRERIIESCTKGQNDLFQECESRKLNHRSTTVHSR